MNHDSREAIGRQAVRFRTVVLSDALVLHA